MVIVFPRNGMSARTWLSSDADCPSLEDDEEQCVAVVAGVPPEQRASAHIQIRKITLRFADPSPTVSR